MADSMPQTDVPLSAIELIGELENELIANSELISQLYGTFDNYLAPSSPTAEKDKAPFNGPSFVHERLNTLACLIDEQRRMLRDIQNRWVG